jgi:GntR family transcriptional regulator
MMTVSKAYSRLEVEGLVERVRGTGMRIAAPPANRSLAERRQEFQVQVAPALHRARQLGLSDEQILSVVHKVLQGNPYGS